MKGVLIINEKEISIVFKAFCDENRVKILKLLTTGEKCACKLLEEIQVTQPTLSHHMKILCDSNIVVGRKDGKWTYYSLSQQGVDTAKILFEQITTINTSSTQEDKTCCK